MNDLNADDESDYEKEKRIILKTIDDAVSRAAKVAFTAYFIVMGLFAGAYLRYGIGNAEPDTLMEKFLYIGTAFMLLGMFLVVPILIWIVWYPKREIARLEWELL